MALVFVFFMCQLLSYRIQQKILSFGLNSKDYCKDTNSTFMTKHYYWALVTGFCLSLATVFGYFTLSSPAESSNDMSTDTQYAFTEVEGALQPLPEITYINERWRDLGKALFNSPLLSADNSISCASCHLVDYGGDDGFPVSTGINSATGTRNSPTVLNAVFNVAQFWDGRSSTLSEQVAGPIHNPIEMGSNWQQIIDKLNRDELFQNRFYALNPDGVTMEAIVRAIATYEESLVTTGSPVDRYLLGNDSALTKQQKQGFVKFHEYGCITCHQGVNIGGNLFQKIGRIDEASDVLTLDLGRYNVTGKEHDKLVFKVPSLRNVADTAPYFHNGQVNTLQEAIQIMGRVQLGRELTEQDIADIEAFLLSLSAPVQEI